MQESSPELVKSGWTGTRLILAWIVILLVYAAIRINIIGIPLNRDEGVFGYIGQVILHHGIPYRDAIDSKPPGVFYLYALALLFVSPTARGIHIFLHVYNFITLIAVFFLGKSCFRSDSAGLWSAFVYALFSASPVIQGYTASTEMFMLLPITLSVFFAVIAARKGSVLLALLSGFSGALACWIKQVAVFSIAFAFIYLAAYGFTSLLRTRTLARIKGRLIGGWIVGAVGISAVVVAYFFFEGALKEFYYWSFTHNFYYSARFSSASRTEMLMHWLREFLREDFFIAAIGLFYSLYALLRRDGRVLFSLGFLSFSFLGTRLGAGYGHYFAQMAPALALAAGLGISELLVLIPANGRKAVGLACGLVLIGCPVLINSRIYLERSPEKIGRELFGINPFNESVKIAHYIAEHSRPRDRVFILGSEPEILFYAQRRSATPFGMIYPLTFEHPRYKEFQERLWSDLSSSPPKFVVVVNIPTSLAWDHKADLIILTARIYQLIRRDYHLVDMVSMGNDDIFLYQRTDIRGP